jgi:hypothetical protein
MSTGEQTFRQTVLPHTRLELWLRDNHTCMRVNWVQVVGRRVIHHPADCAVCHVEMVRVVILNFETG